VPRHVTYECHTSVGVRQIDIASKTYNTIDKSYTKLNSKELVQIFSLSYPFSKSL